MQQTINDFGKGRILIVEDEKIIQLDLLYQLEQLGYVVAGLASSGEEAISQATHLEPDLVLMDVRLKGEMDGIEAAREIQSARHIPVIYLTAQNRAQLIEEPGAPHSFLAKPFRTADLKAALNHALAH